MLCSEVPNQATKPTSFKTDFFEHIHKGTHSWVLQVWFPLEPSLSEGDAGCTGSERGGSSSGHLGLPHPSRGLVIMATGSPQVPKQENMGFSALTCSLISGQFLNKDQSTHRGHAKIQEERFLLPV